MLKLRLGPDLRNKLFLLSLMCNGLFFFMLNMFYFPSIIGQTNAPCDKPCVQKPTSSLYQFETNLLVLILISPYSIKERDTIRKTWALHLPHGAVLRFMIGINDTTDNLYQSLDDELVKNDDLVFLQNFTESYQSLTKKLLTSLVWAAENVKFKYLLKVDADSFVRVDKLLYELESKPDERFYWGFFDGRAHVKKRGKYKETNYVLCDRYIPYALGGGYVISTDLVQYVAKNADYLKLYNNEDTSLGTWLAPLDIVRSHDTRFDTEYVSRGCSNSYIITHKQGMGDMIELYSTLRNLNRLCLQEFRTRLSYNYNWTVEPSKCCDRIVPDVNG